MNSAPHLLSEDRPEFERVLDEALRDEDIRVALAEAAPGLGSDHLRGLAVNATATITACAVTEYEHYLKIRTQARELASGRRRGRPATSTGGAEDQRATDGSSVRRLSGAVDGTAGAGVVAAVAVLTPILAGTSALILLASGYLLKLADPDPAVAAPLRFAGWLFAAIAATGTLIGMIGVMFTALRNPAADTATLHADRSPEVVAARESWRRALLERGVRPFLLQALTTGDTGHPAAAEPTPARQASGGEVRRTPSLGYSAPGFTSPNPDEPGAHRSPPDYASPRYTSPRYSGPSYSGPDFDTGAGDGPDPGHG